MKKAKGWIWLLISKTILSWSLRENYIPQFGQDPDFKKKNIWTSIFFIALYQKVPEALEPQKLGVTLSISLRKDRDDHFCDCGACLTVLLLSSPATPAGCQSVGLVPRAGGVAPPQWCCGFTGPARISPLGLQTLVVHWLWELHL